MYRHYLYNDGTTNNNHYSVTMKYVNKKLRARIEKRIGKQTLGAIRLFIQNLFNSGVCTDVSEITDKMIDDYATFVSYFPRIKYDVRILEKAKIVANKHGIIAGNELYKLVCKIKPINVRTLYKWFSTLNLKYSTKQDYHPSITVVIFYLAIIE